MNDCQSVIAKDVGALELLALPSALQNTADRGIFCQASAYVRVRALTCTYVRARALTCAYVGVRAHVNPKALLSAQI